MKTRGPYIPTEPHILQSAYMRKPESELPVTDQWRVDRLLELHRQASELAAREPTPEREFAAALKEFAYVYKRASVAEQGEYHHLVASAMPPSALTTYLTIQHRASKFAGWQDQPFPANKHVLLEPVSARQIFQIVRAGMEDANTEPTLFEPNN